MLTSYSELHNLPTEDFICFWLSKRYEDMNPSRPSHYLWQGMIWAVCDVLEHKLTSVTLTRDARGLKRVVSRVPSDITCETVKLDKCWHPDQPRKTELHLSMYAKHKPLSSLFEYVNDQPIQRGISIICCHQTVTPSSVHFIDFLSQFNIGALRPRSPPCHSGAFLPAGLAQFCVGRWINVGRDTYVRIHKLIISFCFTNLTGTTI